MSIALAVITDGRSCVHDTIASASAMLEGPITERWLYDDSGDASHTYMLRERYEPHGFTVLAHPNGRQGFGGAIRFVWQTLLARSDADYIWWQEDDFTFNREVPLPQLLKVLDTNAELAQIALRRQPWNDEERAAGGIIEMHPGDYVERHDPFGNTWVEHRRNFTTNPCLFRRSLMRRGWPDIAHSEGHFGIALASEGHRFAYWGPKDASPHVHHIGEQRVGSGY